MITERAYAKINLYLAVENKRNDGYHNIKTLMHEIDLYDSIFLECLPADSTSVELITVPHDVTDRPEDNLAYRAAVAYLNKINNTARVKIRLEKRIPTSAGLGGGSADAAAVLRALNRIFGSYLSAESMIELAATLGSDVPFCLVGGTSLCLGRGEILTPVPSLKNAFILIAKGNESVSTARAYALLDERIASDTDTARRAYTELSEYLAGNINAFPELYNVFESVIIPECPSVAEIKEVMLKHNAVASLMSGSGPTVFGIFENEQDRASAAAALASLGISVFIA